MHDADTITHIIPVRFRRIMKMAASAAPAGPGREERICKFLLKYVETRHNDRPHANDFTQAQVMDMLAGMALVGVIDPNREPLLRKHAESMDNAEAFNDALEIARPLIDLSGIVPRPVQPRVTDAEAAENCRVVREILSSDPTHPQRQQRVITKLRALAVDAFPADNTPPCVLSAPFLAWRMLAALAGEQEVHRATLMKAGFTDFSVVLLLVYARQAVVENGLRPRDD
jgi:hypothetical protein